MNLLKPVIVLAMLLFVLPVSSAYSFFGASSGVYNDLAELADSAASEMKGDLNGRRLYLDRLEIRDERDGTISRFSSTLSNELERALSKAGFSFEGSYNNRFQSDADRQKGSLLADLTDYKVMVAYSRSADKVQVHIRVRDNKAMTVRSLKNSYSIPIASLSGAFDDTLENRLYGMVSRISGPLGLHHQTGVYVPVILETRKKYPSPFSEYVTSRVKAILSEQTPVKVIDDKETIERLVASRIVKRTSPEAVSGAADALLEGTYLRSTKRSINLSVALKDAEGKTISRADEEIPFSLISYSLENSTAEALAQITDIENESAKGVVTIETTRGGDYQAFLEGETVAFRLRVTKPLYVYMYNINSKAEAELLYPRPGTTEHPKSPGITYNLPDDSWEIQVTPPFGTDAVKIFASDRRLPIPTISNNVATRSFKRGVRGLTGVDKVRKELSSQKMINGYDLVDWYKGVMARSGAPLYEATLYIETRARR